MDIFIEKIVAKKNEPKDILLSVGVVLLTLVLSFVVLALSHYLFGFGLLLIAGLIYLCYRVIISRSVEFEYSLTNNELDIDKIIHKKRRKHLLTIDAKKIEIFAPISHDEFKRHYNNPQSNVKILKYCSSMEAEGLYFIIFFDSTGNKNLIIFEPNAKMIEGFKRYNPSKVFEA